MHCLKGDLTAFVDGAHKLDDLYDKDRVLILESCSHHSVEDDIGKVKIPKLVRTYSGKEIEFEHFSGHDFLRILINIRSLFIAEPA